MTPRLVTASTHICTSTHTHLHPCTNICTNKKWVTELGVVARAFKSLISALFESEASPREGQREGEMGY